jgi:hypothetical protein
MKGSSFSQVISYLTPVDFYHIAGFIENLHREVTINQIKINPYTLYDRGERF